MAWCYWFEGLALGLGLVWGLGVVNVYHYGLSLQVVIYGDDLFMCMDHEYILRCMVMILVRIMVLFSV